MPKTKGREVAISGSNFVGVDLRGNGEKTIRVFDEMHNVRVTEDGGLEQRNSSSIVECISDTGLYDGYGAVDFSLERPMKIEDYDPVGGYIPSTFQRTGGTWTVSSDKIQTSSSNCYATLSFTEYDGNTIGYHKKQKISFIYNAVTGSTSQIFQIKISTSDGTTVIPFYFATSGLKYYVKSTATAFPSPISPVFAAEVPVVIELDCETGILDVTYNGYKISGDGIEFVDSSGLPVTSLSTVKLDIPSGSSGTLTFDELTLKCDSTPIHGYIYMYDSWLKAKAIADGTTYWEVSKGISTYSWRSKFCATKFGDEYFVQTADAVYKFDGAEFIEITEETAYAPIVLIGRSPSGTTPGTDNEAYNLLGSGFRVKFSSDGSATTYNLQFKELASNKVELRVTTSSGVNYYHEGVSFTVNRIDGSINLSAGTTPLGAIASGTNNVELKAFKNFGYDEKSIERCTIAKAFSGVTESRLFVTGNAEHPGKDWYSGINDMTYFPEDGVDFVADSSPIVGYAIHYGKMIIFKENSIWARTYAVTDTGEPQFSREIVSSSLGAVANSVIMLDNNPLFIEKKSGKIYELVANEFGLNRVAEEISAGALSLATEDMLKTYGLNAVVNDKSNGEIIWFSEYKGIDGFEAVVYNYAQSKRYDRRSFYNYFYDFEIQGCTFLPEQNGLVALGFHDTYGTLGIYLFTGMDAKDQIWDTDVTYASFPVGAWVTTGEIDFGYPNILKFYDSVVCVFPKDGPIGIQVDALYHDYTFETTTGELTEEYDVAFISTLCFSFSEIDFTSFTFCSPLSKSLESRKARIMCAAAESICLRFRPDGAHMFKMKEFKLNAVLLGEV